MRTTRLLDASMALFRALLAQRKPAVMIRFPGESHNLSRTGRPLSRIERMNHIVKWFDMFLNAKVCDDYGPTVREAAEEKRFRSEPTAIP